MAKIFISTNGDKPKNLYLSDEDKNEVENFLLQNGFLENVNNVEIEVYKDVFLISDELEKLSTHVLRNTDYLLHHNSIKDGIKGLFDKRAEGNHIIGIQFKYKNVFDILLEDKIENDSKAQLIIEFLFPTSEAILGKKLDLLHNLLVPPADFAEANKQWEEIETTVESARASGISVSLATDENALTTFQNKVNGMNDPFDPDYIKALADLRDALLSA